MKCAACGRSINPKRDAHSYDVFRIRGAKREHVKLARCKACEGDAAATARYDAKVAEMDSKVRYAQLDYNSRWEAACGVAVAAWERKGIDTLDDAEREQFARDRQYLADARQSLREAMDECNAASDARAAAPDQIVQK